MKAVRGHLVRRLAGCWLLFQCSFNVVGSSFKFSVRFSPRGVGNGDAPVVLPTSPTHRALPSGLHRLAEAAAAAAGGAGPEDGHAQEEAKESSVGGFGNWKERMEKGWQAKVHQALQKRVEYSKQLGGMLAGAINSTVGNATRRIHTLKSADPTAKACLMKASDPFVAPFIAKESASMPFVMIPPKIGSKCEAPYVPLHMTEQHEALVMTDDVISSMFSLAPASALNGTNQYLTPTSLRKAHELTEKALKFLREEKGEAEREEALKKFLARLVEELVQGLPPEAQKQLADDAELREAVEVVSKRLVQSTLVQWTLKNVDADARRAAEDIVAEVHAQLVFLAVTLEEMEQEDLAAAALLEETSRSGADGASLLHPGAPEDPAPHGRVQRIARRFYKESMGGPDAIHLEHTPAGKFVLRDEELRCALPFALPCLPGMACPGGVELPIVCPKGTLCTPLIGDTLEGSSVCSIFGCARPVPCFRGHFCPSPGVLPVPCPPGSHCPSGSIVPQPCPAGFFCPHDAGRESFRTVAAMDELQNVPLPATIRFSRNFRTAPLTTVEAEESDAKNKLIDDRFFLVSEEPEEPALAGLGGRRLLSIESRMGELIPVPGKFDLPFLELPAGTSVTLGKHDPEAAWSEMHIVPLGMKVKFPFSTAKMNCPKGFYCDLGLTEPKECPLFSQCERNSTAPNWAQLASVEGAVAVVLAVMLGLAYTWGWRLSKNMKLSVVGTVLLICLVAAILIDPIFFGCAFLLIGLILLGEGVSRLDGMVAGSGRPTLSAITKWGLLLVGAVAGAATWLVLDPRAATSISLIFSVGALAYCLVHFPLLGKLLCLLAVGVFAFVLQRLEVPLLHYGTVTGLLLLQVFGIGCVELHERGWLRPLGAATQEEEQRGGEVDAAVPVAAAASALQPEQVEEDDDDDEREAADEGPAAAPGIRIDIRGMNFRLANGKKLLQDLHLGIEPGSSVAVMGNSGSGKTTFLSVLSGRAWYGQADGEVLLNANPGLGVGDLRAVTGFVPQDDVMHRELTVWENVYYSAKLRLPSNYSEAQITARVDQALKDLGLEHIAKSAIGDELTRGISGGQRKRVSIAMEVVAEPKLLFLDEPTSGLDASSSHNTVQSFCHLAKERGCTTIAVIHQPRFETLLLFDQLVLLSTGGLLLYAGPTSQIVEHFKQRGMEFPNRANPADVLLDAISTNEQGEYPFPSATPEILAAELRRRAVEEEEAAAATRGAAGTRPTVGPGRKAYKRFTAKWGQGMSICMARGMAQALTRMQLLVVQVVLLGCALFCISFMSSDDLFGFVQRLPMALLMTFLFAALCAQRTFGGNERLVYAREASVGVHTLPYFAAKDATALLEVLSLGLGFAVVFGQVSGSSHTSFGDWLSTGIAFIYAVYGLNFVLAICLEPGTAQLAGILGSFMCTMLAGMQPAKTELSSILGGYGSILLAASPTQWAFGFLFWKEAKGLSPLVRSLSEDTVLSSWGFDLRTAVALPNPEGKADLLRWREGSGWVCGKWQLLLLGVTYRFLAVCALVLILKVKNGGMVAICGKPLPGGSRVFKLLQRLRFTALLSGVVCAVFLQFFLIVNWATCQENVF